MQNPRIIRRTLSAGLVLALAAGVIAIATAAVGAPPACQAQNMTTGTKATANLGQLVASAPSGSTIQIKGTCALLNQRVHLTLTFVGKPTKTAPSPTLAVPAGGGTDRKLLLIGAGGNVTLTGLTLTGGSNGSNADLGAGAIENQGALTLQQSLVTGNTGLYGGAIENYGTLIATATTFSGNTAAYQGGAVENFGTATFTDATLAANTSGGYSGAIDNYGTLSLAGHTVVRDNHADLDGGAIDSGYGSLAVGGTSEIRGNTATYNGGGVATIAGGTVSITADATVRGNTAGPLGVGGGVYCDAPGLLTAVAGAISGNQPDDVSGCDPV